MNRLITNIRQLVTPTGNGPLNGERMREILIRENVSLLLQGERITQILPEGMSPPQPIDEVVDACEGVVLPGLIDPLIGARVRCTRSLCAEGPPGPSEGRGSLPPSSSLRRRISSSLSEILHNGTTTIEVTALWSERIGVEDVLEAVHTAASEAVLRPRTCVCGAPPHSSKGSKEDRITTMIGETIPALRRRGLATSCTVLCGDGGYERKEARAVLRAARGAGMDLRVAASGTGADAVLLAAELEVQSVDRLVSPRQAELEKLRRAGVCPVVVPGEAVEGDRPWPDARRMIDAGLAVALGSGADLLCGGIQSMFTVMALAVRRMDLSPEEAMTATLVNAAAAIGMAHEVGSIEPGKRANLVILDIEDYRDIPGYFVGVPIRAVIVDGRMVKKR